MSSALGTSDAFRSITARLQAAPHLHVRTVSFYVSAILANVIFPAFAPPYFSPIIMPAAGLAALGSEWFCYREFSKNSNRPGLGEIMLANAVSWLVGVFLIALLPDGIIHRPAGDGGTVIPSKGPHFAELVVAAFGAAWLLSIIIEFGVLSWTTRRNRIRGLLSASAIANTTSYVLLALCWFRFGF